MAEPVIQVRGLGKKYRLGKADKKADTILGTVFNGLKQPFENLKQIRSLSKLDTDSESIFWALRDVSFDVHEGDVLGIIGHNGAGKSTLLKILSRVTEPTEGEIRLQGRVAALLEVGTGFHPELTGRENVYMNGTILGMTKKEIDRKFDEIIDFSGVEKHLDTAVKFYSSGMKVRLGFAVAAHLEPEILIIDEVLAVGDAEFQKKCLGKMEDVAQQGRTVLFVSHNLTALTNLCKQGLVLKNGFINFLGTSTEAVNHYLNAHSSSQTSIRYDIENAPGNDEAKFVAAELSALGGGIQDLREGEGFKVDFEFSYFGTDGANLDVTFHLTDEYGNLIFVGSSAFDEKTHRFNRGSVRFSCLIPSDIIQRGHYTISKAILIRNKGISLVGVKNPLIFEVRPKINSFLGWMAQKEGIIKPKLTWSVLND